MSYIGAYSRFLFGGADAFGRASGGANHQKLAESITTTTSRIMRGPQRNGHFSFHALVRAGTSPVGSLTVWYSNLPNPNPDLDDDWVQDTNIAAIDLAVVANAFVNVGNVNAEHVRLKVTRTSGTIALIVWARVEGADH